MKSAAAPKQEQYRLQVEEAEDKLVQMTETAIGLMKAVLENVSLRSWHICYRHDSGANALLDAYKYSPNLSKTCQTSSTRN